MDPEAARKLSPEARRALENPELPAERRLSVLVVVDGPLGPGERERFAGAGCRVRSVAGDTVTADLPTHAFPALAALDFVRYVELSRRLRLEQGDGSPSSAP